MAHPEPFSPQERWMLVGLWVYAKLLVAALIVLGFVYFGIHKSLARDNGQWAQLSDSDSDSSDYAQAYRWVGRQMQPDAWQVSCCGPADAYWADKFVDERGDTFAVVTDTRSDAPLGRPHIDVGTKIRVPPQKVISPIETKEPNQTGHGWIWVREAGGGNWTVYCVAYPPDNG